MIPSPSPGSAQYFSSLNPAISHKPWNLSTLLCMPQVENRRLQQGNTTGPPQIEGAHFGHSTRSNLATERGARAVRRRPHPVSFTSRLTSAHLVLTRGRESVVVVVKRRLMGECRGRSLQTSAGFSRQASDRVIPIYLILSPSLQNHGYHLRLSSHKSMHRATCAVVSRACSHRLARPISCPLRRGLITLAIESSW